ncbi:hypothetical protein EXIGLDRAFT_694120 [Exidia glandulosa HHB12029]|uniref:Uncharacterized protein n=1 Tax=Exidia glandulosa HHB12029 TaxID=1314781 RepID=A0A165GUP0_EXIGL|nr:hypothetical protein EXIGLDRAFT_694120 [Exidia glandulosa HHB12029]
MFSLVHTATALNTGVAVLSLAEFILLMVLLSTPISDRTLRWYAGGLAAGTGLFGLELAVLGIPMRRYKPRPGGVETSTPTTIARALLLTLTYIWWAMFFGQYASSISEFTRLYNVAMCNAVLYIGIALAVLYIICIVLFAVVLWNFCRNVEGHRPIREWLRLTHSLTCPAQSVMVFVPFISSRRDSAALLPRAYFPPPKTTSSPSPQPTDGPDLLIPPQPEPIDIPGITGKTTTEWGSGGGDATTVPDGALFAGRTIGGGTRAQVYVGFRAKGSSEELEVYFTSGLCRGDQGPDLSGSIQQKFVCHLLAQFGAPDNSSRPGGAEYQLVVQSHAGPDPGSWQAEPWTYHVVSDHKTVTSLIHTLMITANCATFNTPLSALSFNGSASEPQPENTVQYYRASSVALTLDGYNNTAALSDDATVAPVPLPSGLNQTFLECLNRTIGESVILVDAPVVNSSPGDGSSSPTPTSKMTRTGHNVENAE